MYSMSRRTLRPYLLRRHMMFLVLALPLALSVCSQRASSQCVEEHGPTGEEPAEPTPPASERGCGQEPAEPAAE
jgi:hypothetical protein